jgi:hypothetical protein
MEEMRRASLPSSRARSWWFKESLLLRKINGKYFGDESTVEIVDWSERESNNQRCMIASDASTSHSIAFE